MHNQARISCIFLLAIFGIARFACAQSETPGQRKKLFEELPAASSDTVKARAYLRFALYFLDKNPTNKNDLDSAMLCLRKAAAIMLPYNKAPQIRDIRCLEARQRLKYKDSVGGRRIFMELIDGYAVAGKKSEEGNIWLTYGTALTRFDKFTPEIVSHGTTLLAGYRPAFLKCMDKARELAVQAGDKRLQARVCAELASYYMASGSFDEAEKQILKLAPLQKASAAFKPYEVAYVQAVLEFLLKRDMVKMIALSLATVKNAAELKCEADARSIYIFLGRTYRITGDRAEMSAAFQKYLAVCRELDLPADPIILNYYLSTVISKNKNEALKFVQLFDPEDLHNGSSRRFTIAKSYAQVYSALKQFDNAQRYFTLALKIATDGKLTERDEFQSEFGKFYFVWKKYDLARPYFEATINSADPKISLSALESAHNFLFRIDSAMGDYKSALRHFKATADLKDTLQNQLTRKNIAELNIQYETAKKQKDIELLNTKIRVQHLDSLSHAKSYQLLRSKVKLQQVEAVNKEKSIQLLNSQAANKEKSIQLLQGQASLQRSEIERGKVARNLMFTGAGLLVLILLLILNQFRIYRRNSQVVSKHNGSLQQLLKEKEILMREIHHRVKNNLQMVLSLLDSQSVYLTDDALKAIRSSYNRVLAMSLIHQKLYIAENNTSHIDIAGYLWELITYLQESFSTGGRIVFEMNAGPITLDIVQAVPLGLIVNEAVTNAIKYAFPGAERGIIAISLEQDGEGCVSLVVSDNGIGLPEQVDRAGGSSLGLRLIKGLSDNLEGALEFGNSKNNKGTCIRLVFLNSYPFLNELNG